MKKFAGLPAELRPTIFNALPELQYPRRFNAAEVLLEGALGKGWGARSAILHPGGAISYQQVVDEAHRWAHALRSAGLQPGDRLLIRLHDTPELIFVMLAAFIVGAVAVPTYVQLRSKDLAYRAKDSGARVAVVGAELLDDFYAAADASPELRVLVVGGAAGRFTALESLLPRDVGGRRYEITEVDDVAMIIYTSGSTGDPKGTVQCHGDLIAICDTYCRYCVDLREDDVIAGPPSMPFALALGFMFLFPMRFGAAAYLDRDKSVETLAAAVARYKATIFVAVPTYYNRLLRYMRERNLRFETLRFVGCGGEPLPEELERAWPLQAGVPITQFLGTTEMLHIFLAIRPGEDEIRIGAIGRAVPGYEVQVLDPATWQPVPPGEKGLLAARGVTGTHYWKKEEQQRKVVIGGWNVFQDVVWSDPDGYIHYVVRNDDMIVSGGHNIAPVEVESVLMRHPHILECACIGVPDLHGDRISVVKAFVALRPHVQPSEQAKHEIQEFFKREGQPYMYPREIEFLESLPKTLSGKVLRSELKNRSH
jgi:2-aminobenzoate-CoA ligase